MANHKPPKHDRDGPQFADTAALGDHLIDRLRQIAAIDSIAPGSTADWGLQLGEKIFVLTIRIVSAEEIGAIL